MIIFPWQLMVNTSYHAQVQITTDDLCLEGVTISRDQSKGRFLGYMTSIVQSEASIQVT